MTVNGHGAQAFNPSTKELSGPYSAAEKLTLGVLGASGLAPEGPQDLSSNGSLEFQYAQSFARVVDSRRKRERLAPLSDKVDRQKSSNGRGSRVGFRVGDEDLSTRQWQDGSPAAEGWSSSSIKGSKGPKIPYTSGSNLEQRREVRGKRIEDTRSGSSKADEEIAGHKMTPSCQPASSYNEELGRSGSSSLVDLSWEVKTDTEALGAKEGSQPLGAAAYASVRSKAGVRRWPRKPGADPQNSGPDHEKIQVVSELKSKQSGAEVLCWECNEMFVESFRAERIKPCFPVLQCASDLLESVLINGGRTAQELAFRTWSNWGHLYSEVDDPPQALEYFSKAWEICDGRGGPAGRCWNMGAEAKSTGLINLAEVHHQLGNYRTSANYAEKATSLLTEAAGLGPILSLTSSDLQALEGSEDLLRLLSISLRAEGTARESMQTDFVSSFERAAFVSRNISTYDPELAHSMQSLYMEALHRELRNKTECKNDRSSIPRYSPAVRALSIKSSKAQSMENSNTVADKSGRMSWALASHGTGGPIPESSDTKRKPLERSQAEARILQKFGMRPSLPMHSKHFRKLAGFSAMTLQQSFRCHKARTQQLTLKNEQRTKYANHRSIQIQTAIRGALARKRLSSERLRARRSAFVTIQSFSFRTLARCQYIQKLQAQKNRLDVITETTGAGAQSSSATMLALGNSIDVIGKNATRVDTHSHAISFTSQTLDAAARQETALQATRHTEISTHRPNAERESQYRAQIGQRLQEEAHELTTLWKACVAEKTALDPKEFSQPMDKPEDWVDGGATEDQEYDEIVDPSSAQIVFEGLGYGDREIERFLENADPDFTGEISRTSFFWGGAIMLNPSIPTHCSKQQMEAHCLASAMLSCIQDPRSDYLAISKCREVLGALELRDSDVNNFMQLVRHTENLGHEVHDDLAQYNSFSGMVGSHAFLKAAVYLLLEIKKDESGKSNSSSQSEFVRRDSSFIASQILNMAEELRPEDDTSVVPNFATPDPAPRAERNEHSLHEKTLEWEVLQDLDISVIDPPLSQSNTERLLEALRPDTAIQCFKYIKQHTASTILQCCWRQRLARSKILKLGGISLYPSTKVCAAHEVIKTLREHNQALQLLELKAYNITLVQTAWRACIARRKLQVERLAKPKRLLEHLMMEQQQATARMQLWWSVGREARLLRKNFQNNAASRLQVVARKFMARRQMLLRIRQEAASRIQRFMVSKLRWKILRRWQDKHQAALKIQNARRCLEARRAFELRQEVDRRSLQLAYQQAILAASRIQNNMRCMRARHDLRKRKQDRDCEQASRVIQRVWQGHKGRTSHHLAAKQQEQHLQNLAAQRLQMAWKMHDGRISMSNRIQAGYELGRRMRGALNRKFLADNLSRDFPASVIQRASFGHWARADLQFKRAANKLVYAAKAHLIRESVTEIFRDELIRQLAQEAGLDPDIVCIHCMASIVSRHSGDYPHGGTPHTHTHGPRHRHKYSRRRQEAELVQITEEDGGWTVLEGQSGEEHHCQDALQRSANVAVRPATWVVQEAVKVKVEVAEPTREAPETSKDADRAREQSAEIATVNSGMEKSNAHQPLSAKAELNGGTEHSPELMADEDKETKTAIVADAHAAEVKAASGAANLANSPLKDTEVDVSEQKDETRSGAGQAEEMRQPNASWTVTALTDEPDRSAELKVSESVEASALSDPPSSSSPQPILRVGLSGSVKEGHI